MPEDLTPDGRYDQVSTAWIIDQLRKENVALRGQLIAFRKAAQKFVTKVDRGRAKSVETYREMKELIDGTASLGI
jgi:hypothetical protein